MLACGRGDPQAEITWRLDNALTARPPVAEGPWWRGCNVVVAHHSAHSGLKASHQLPGVEQPSSPRSGNDGLSMPPHQPSHHVRRRNDSRLKIGLLKTQCCPSGTFARQHLRTQIGP
jgi:hypothetical protein